MLQLRLFNCIFLLRQNFCADAYQEDTRPCSSSPPATCWLCKLTECFRVRYFNSLYILTGITGAECFIRESTAPTWKMRQHEHKYRSKRLYGFTCSLTACGMLLVLGFIIHVTNTERRQTLRILGFAPWKCGNCHLNRHNYFYFFPVCYEARNNWYTMCINW